MVVEIDRRPRVQRFDVRVERLLEAFARLVAEFEHPLPVLVPSDAFGHWSAELFFEERMTVWAPAAVRRAETLVEHVNVKAVNAVGELLGDDLLHRFKITGVETEAADGLAVRAAHFPFRMRLEEMTGLLDDAVSDNGEPMLARLIGGVPQRVAYTEPGRLRQQNRIVIGIIAVAHPEHKVLAVCRHGAADNFASVEPRAVAHIVRAAIAELRAGRANLQADAAVSKPRCCGRGIPAKASAKHRKRHQAQMNEAPSHVF